MSADTDLPLYPRGQIALGQGDLRQVTDVKATVKNGAKVAHTLRVNGAGVILGNVELSGSASTIIPETGEERDYFDLVMSGKQKPARMKFPAGKTRTLAIVISEVTGQFTLEEGTKIDFNFVGVMKRTG